MQLLQFDGRVLKLLSKKLVFHFELLYAFETLRLEQLQLVHMLSLLLVQLLFEYVNLGLHEVVVLLLLFFTALQILRLKLHLSARLN